VTINKLLNNEIASISPKVRAKIDNYYKILADIKKSAETKKASDVITFTLNRSGVEESLSTKNTEDEERLQNIKELVSLATVRYDSYSPPDGILKLIEDAALATDQDELDRKTKKQGGVTLMTIHAAKGLEYKNVFISGLEDGLFPHEKTSSFGELVDEEEERRLFYVALTRAKEKVFLSYAQMRTVFGQRLPRLPSEFLLDIDEEYISTEDFPVETSKSEGKIMYLD
jgi:DNA helicase-2/ATP-dependent DNA helicase PcrA